MARKHKGQRIAVVDWFDASTQRGPLRPDEMNPFVILRTVGWLVREDKESVTVAMDYFEDEGTYRDIAHIPRVNIRRMRVLKG